MAHTVTGTLGRVKEITTQFGPMPIIYVNSTRYSVKGKNVPSLSPGETVTFDAEQDGKWWNARNLTKTAPGGTRAEYLAGSAPLSPPAAPGSPIAVPAGAGAGPSRDTLILRQNAFNVAASILGPIMAARVPELAKLDSYFTTEDIFKALLTMAEKVFTITSQGFGSDIENGNGKK